VAPKTQYAPHGDINLASQFDDRGSYALRGIPGEWQLYAV